MNSISKASFYKNWFDIANTLKAPEERLSFYEMIFNYYFNGIEPSDVSPVVSVVFTAIKPNIDAEVNRKNGGAPKGNNNARKQPKNNLENNVDSTLCLKKTNDVDVYEDEYVYEDVDVNTNTPNTHTPAQKEYSKNIFNLFKDAGLPCAKQNEVSFLMSDFSNAIRFLRNSEDYKHIHSDDVLGAVKNYIEVLNSSKTYFTAKMGFYKFVQSKKFYDFLPANYDFNNFLKFENTENQEHQKAEQKVFYKVCPNCNEIKLHYVQDGQVGHYICDNCQKIYKFGEV